MPLYTFCEAKLHFFFGIFRLLITAFPPSFNAFPKNRTHANKHTSRPKKITSAISCVDLNGKNLQEKPKNFDEIGENTLSHPLQHTHPVTLKGQPRSDRFFN